MNEQLLIVANLLVCSMGGWLCLCRMTKMSERETKLSIRFQYMLLFCFFSASGWSFIFGDQATTIQLFESAVIASYIVMGVPAWKGGQPSYARR